MRAPGKIPAVRRRSRRESLSDRPMQDPAISVRPARNVASATLVSRVLGLIRDTVTVTVFLPGIADAIILAWTVPNMFRRLFGEGALSAALVPVLAEAEKAGGPAHRDRVAGAVVTALTMFLAPLTLAILGLLWLAPESWWLSLFESTEVGRETLHLLRWMLPYLVFICVAAQMQAMANLAGRFFVPALAPAVANVLWIIAAGVAAWCATEEANAQWVAAAVLAAGGLQVALQWFELERAGVHLRPHRITPEVREVLRRAAPMFVGLAAGQLNLLVDRWVAEAFVEGDGAVRQLYLGNRLMQLPLGLVGVALGTAIYPVLSRAATNRDERAMSTTLGEALRVSLCLGLPAMVGLMMLAPSIMALLFEHGEFTTADGATAAACLVAYAPCILAHTAVLLFARVDYARGRQRRVVLVGLVAVVLNVVLDFALVSIWQAEGLALATTVAAFVNALLLAWGLGVWRHMNVTTELLGPAARMAVVAAAMGLKVWAVRHFMVGAGESLARTLAAAAEVVPAILLGALIYFIGLWLLARREWDELLAVVRFRRKTGSS